MAVGTTTNFNWTRDELITQALVMVGKVREGGKASAPQLATAIKTLNAIVREKDGTGDRIWGLGQQPTTITLQANVFRYTSSEGLPTNIVRPSRLGYRDNQGNDFEVDLVNHEQWARIADKFETGSPAKALFVKHRDRSSQELVIVPTPNSVDTPSEVTGTDALNYTCIRAHTADSNNKPITGANYKLYWEQTGSSGSVWVTGTSYLAAKSLRLWYIRPLFDFDSASDNPDMPQEWHRTLLYELASDLSDGSRLPIDERTWLSEKAGRGAERLFNKSEVETQNDFHNKAEFD